MTKIGEMRCRLTLQDSSVVADGAGGLTTSWANVGGCWGNLRPLTGSDSLSALRHANDVSHRFTTRWRGDLNVKVGMRFVLDSRVFNILSVSNVDERNRSLEMMLIEE